MVRIEQGRARRCLQAELVPLMSAIYRDASLWRQLVLRLKLHSCPFDRLIMQIPEAASILDVGCGFGLFLGLLAMTGRPFRGVGFDRSAEGITRARAMAKRVKVIECEADLRFECSDICEPWPAGPFDVVSIIDVLHHLPISSRRGFLASAYARLRPGGLLVLKDISDRPFWRAYANRCTDLVMSREWVRYTTASEIISWGQKLGLEIVTQERINRQWYGHVLLVFQRPRESTL